MYQRLKNIIDVLVTFILYYVAGVALHEMWHYRIANMLGYQVQAHFGTWFSGWVELAVFPTNPLHIILIGIVGGGGVALFYWLISLFTDDWETKMILNFFAPLHGSYAICEVLYLFELISIQLLGIIPVIVVTIILLWTNREAIGKKMGVIK